MNLDSFSYIISKLPVDSVEGIYPQKLTVKSPTYPDKNITIEIPSMKEDVKG